MNRIFTLEEEQAKLVVYILTHINFLDSIYLSYK